MCLYPTCIINKRINRILIDDNSYLKKKEQNQLQGKTLTAAAMASPTTSGAAAQVPSPSEGILAPVFNLKKRNPSSICERDVC